MASSRSITQQPHQRRHHRSRHHKEYIESAADRAPKTTSHHSNHKHSHAVARRLLLITATVVVATLATSWPPTASAVHLTGTYQPQRDFFKLVAKFGFQQTERHAQRDTFGYIFGNITGSGGPPSVALAASPSLMTLAVLDGDKFLSYYQNRTIYDKDVACRIMFGDIDPYAFDGACNAHATGDYLRRVPCPYGRLCPDEDSAANVVAANQFTYVISNLARPSFWYVSLVACYRNTTTCRWQHYNPDAHPTAYAARNSSAHDGAAAVPPVTLHYDLHLVQGRPSRSDSNPLTYEFSFDQQYILEMNLVFFCVYVLLVPLQLYAVRIQKHPVTKLFTLSLVLEFVSLALILWHLVRFAAGGVGNDVLRTTGDILDIFSRTSFMLILLLLAKGWAVTRQQVSRSSWITLLAIWVPYCAFHVVLYVWNRTEVDIVSDIDEYQTWPGLLVLACRTSFMLWFLYELRNTMKYEHSTKKLDFLLHFGASSLVWFIYLPVVAIVALQVSPMWRCKLLLGITNSADCLAYCVMTGLLWPNRSGQYLLLAGTNASCMDELDELNEAPNIVRGDVTIPHDHLANRRSHNEHATVIGNGHANGSPAGLKSPVRQHNQMQLHRPQQPTQQQLLIANEDDHFVDLAIDYEDDDDDDEDVVLSTDDLLRRSMTAQHPQQQQHVPNQLNAVAANVTLPMNGSPRRPGNGDLGNSHRSGQPNQKQRNVNT